MARAGPSNASPVEERILAAAYELFSHRGVRAVGVDEIIERSGVAKATLYKHFPSKEALALAFLERREHRWTVGFLETEAAKRGSSAEARLLAIFDVFAEWFKAEDYEACSFVNVLLEMRPEHNLGQASIRHLANIRSFIEGWAREAGMREPAEFAWSWQILMKGSIIAAVQGDPDAASRAQTMARQLIESARRPG